MIIFPFLHGSINGNLLYRFGLHVNSFWYNLTFSLSVFSSLRVTYICLRTCYCSLSNVITVYFNNSWVQGN
jgi:hypothetical protein